MFSLAEVCFMELHQLSKNSMQTLWASFQMSFPFYMEIMLVHDEFSRMISDTTELLGQAHDETSLAYGGGSVAMWALYSPRSTVMVRHKSLCHSAYVGFKDDLDAMSFKLRWFQN